MKKKQMQQLVDNANHAREVFRNAWHSAMAMAIDSEEDIKALKAEQHDDHITIERLRAEVEGTTTELVQMRKCYEELQHRFNKREDVRMEQVIKDGGFTFNAPFEGFHGDQPDDDRYTDDGMYRKPANVSLSDNEWRSLTAEQREFLVRHEEIHRLYTNLLAKGIVPTINTDR